MKRLVISSNISKKPFVFETLLKVGDTVMVMSGGNKKKGKTLKGQVGAIKAIRPKSSRVVVEGLNLVKKHKRAANSQEESGILTREGALHISNLMYYSASHKRPFRLKTMVQADGAKVRGFINPETKAFEAI